MIDLHCHILPGIDDGPEMIEDSVAIARAAAASGTRTIIATPHVSWRYPNAPDTIARLSAELGERLRAEEGQRSRSTCRAGDDQIAPTRRTSTTRCNCSPTCARSQAQRDYRRRQRTARPAS